MQESQAIVGAARDTFYVLLFPTVPTQVRTSGLRGT